MPSIDPIVFVAGTASVEFLVLTYALVFAAMKNHFAHKQFRPAVLSLATMSGALVVQNMMLFYSSYLRTSGRLFEYLSFIYSPCWLITNILVMIAGGVLFFTLVIAYPVTRNTMNRRDTDRRS